MRALAILFGLLIFISSEVSLAAVTITPSNQTIKEDATLQLNASVASTWTTTCGYVSSTGLFRAGLYPATCTVTAKAISGGDTGTTTVIVVSPIIMSPVSASTPQGKTQQFNSSAPVTWTAGCGTITASGLYTASGTVGSFCTIKGTAITAPKYNVYGYDHIIAPVGFSVSPTSASLNEGASKQFTASASATWKASCGSISSSGLYVAPLVAGTCTVTATPTAGGTAATASVTVTSPITITPKTASTPQNSTQQFTANVAVKWTTSCGSISGSGLFTATGPTGTCTIKATASSGTAYTATATDTITAGGPLTISPTSATVSEGASKQFTASAGATWSASCGSISSSGLYVAPLVAGACSVTATPTAGGSTASASVTVTSPITITPQAISTPQNSTQQFTADAAVNWSSSCGSISNSGLFTASGPIGVCTITAVASSGTAYTATATDTITSPAVLEITPANPSLVEGQDQQFSSGASATWSASCGSITSSGAFTAPLVEGSCTITATATDGSGKTASTSAAVSSPITITPANASLHALNTQLFSASQSVSWASTCGSVSDSGLFTAPASPATCTLTATASGGTPFTKQAAVNVDVVHYTAWKGGGGTTGDQTNETALTPSNVNASSFGLSWSAAVDGWVNAQPLYMNGLMVNGTPHNVVFIATANDSVYAFDGDTGAQLWQTSLVPGGCHVRVLQRRSDLTARR